MADLGVHLESTPAQSRHAHTAGASVTTHGGNTCTMTFVVPDAPNAILSTLMTDEAPGVSYVTASRLKGERALVSGWSRLWEAQMPPCAEIEPDAALRRMRSRDVDSWIIIIVQEAGRVVAVVGGFVTAVQRKIRIGYTSVHFPRLRAFTLFNDGILWDESSGSLRQVADAMHQFIQIEQLDLVCVRHLASDHPFHAALNEALKPVTASTRRDEDQWLCDLDPNEPEQWMAQHGRKTRYNIRRTTRIFEEATGTPVSPVVYDTDTDVERFIRIADEINAHSYQSSIGVGVSDSERWRSRLIDHARNGRFIGYVLPGAECPLAYMLGERWGRRVRLVATGFDQRYETLSPGKVLLRSAIDDLGSNRGVTILDFGFGDAAYKRLFGTRVVPQVSRAYFAKRGKARWVYRIEAMSMRVNGWISDFAERHGLYDRIKRRARARAQKKDRGTSSE